MKKVVLLILGFLLGALAMYFYCCKDASVGDPIVDLPTPPQGTITPAEIKVLTQAYNPRYQAINDSIFRDVAGGDNRSSWYSLEDLNAFLTLAEAQADSLGYTMDGIRIYPGAHPMEKGLPGYSTYLIVPTGYKTVSEGALFYVQKGGGSDDIDGGNGLNRGENGDPPGINYPQ